MKKWIATLTAFAVLLSLSACGGTAGTASGESSALGGVSEITLSGDSGSGTVSDTTDDTSQSTAPAAGDGKILIAYFSRMGNMNFDPNVDAVTTATVQSMGSDYIGNNKIIADMLSEKTHGDVFFIEQTDKYPAAYRATTDQARTEQQNSTRPALATSVENMEQYDTVILVYPNWWSKLPPGVCTFLASYDFKGKTILPLVTHEGSGLGDTISEIASLCPDATLLDGLAVRGSSVSDAKATVEKWIDDSGILK